MIKIAVIEDDQPIAEMYRLKLSKAGYETAVASNGHEGYELVEKMRPNLILLDLRMPGMSGDEMLEKVREADWGSTIRVIVLTNISKDEAPMSLRMLGIDRYIVKAHHTPSEVVAIVSEVIPTP